MKNINLIMEKWINKNIKIQHPFLKKLTILWPKIVGYELSKYSIPHSFISQNNQDILVIYVYNGSVSIKIQSIIYLIKNRILINIGYQPIKEFRIIQKVGFN